MRRQRRISAVLCARWESQYIQEWLLYYRSINIDHVYLYCNDDTPDELYQQVMPFLQTDDPFVTFHHFPFKGQQFYMYMHFLRAYMWQTEWFVFLDVDEFLRLPPHNDIQRYLDSVPAHWDAIYFNWIFFNNNGFVTRPAGNVLLNYTRRAARLHTGTKTMTRSSRVDIARIVPRRQIWHHWQDLLGADAGLYNVLGHRMQDYFASDVSETTYLADPAVHKALLSAGCIHHYAFKSEGDFLLRYQRGISGDFAGQTTWKELHDRNGMTSFLEQLGTEDDHYLADYWRRVLARGRDRAIVQRPDLPNLALGQPALQSSLSEISRGATLAEDAAGAVNGEISGSYGFHTEYEEFPWWQVDLGGQARIQEIWLYNRIECRGEADRCRNIAILMSDDAQVWIEAYRRHGEPAFGGADGHPLRVVLTPPARARHVRVVMLGQGWFHLDEVEVYGRRSASAG